MLNSAIQLQDSLIEGKGLFATRDIECGAVVWQLDANVITATADEMSKMPKSRQDEFAYFAYESSNGLYVLSLDIDRYMNHSCDPNTWWENDEILVACRDIQAGTEVTYDYSSSEIDNTFSLECNCGSPLCRRVITNRDYLDPRWQAKYQNYLPKHVLQAIADASNHQSG